MKQETPQPLTVDALSQIHHLGLVIESAVRRADPKHHKEVVTALKRVNLEISLRGRPPSAAAGQTLADILREHHGLPGED